MKRIIDLTGANFERINFEEAEILVFDFRDKEINDIEFEIWGARLLVDNFWDHDKSFLEGVPHLDDYYVAGIGKIKMEQVSGIEMIFFPYDKKTCPSRFFVDNRGKALEERWVKGKLGSGNHYLWECVLLKLLSRGNVRFIYAEPNKTNERTRFSWLLPVRLYSNNCSSYCGPFPDNKSGQKAAFSYQTLQLPTGKNTMLSVFLASVISGVSFALLSAILKSIMKPIFNIFPALSAGLYLAL